MQSISSLREAISIKSSLLSNGVNVGNISKTFKPSKASLYSYEMSEKQGNSFPQEVILYNNQQEDLRVFSTIRSNANSPWNLIENNGTVCLNNEDKTFQVDLPEVPKFYDNEIEGENSTKYFQKLGGDTIALVMLNYCEYYARNVQCKFCEIHENFSTVKEQFLRVKTSEKMSSHLIQAIKKDSSIRQVIFNSGNYSTNNNRTYREIIKTLNLTMVGLSSDEINKIAFLVIIAPPEDFSLIKQLKEAGATSVYINMEVWSDSSMQQIVPGKYELGKNTYYKAFDESLKHFGVGYVYTNLILGIQSIDLSQNKIILDESKELDILEQAMDSLIKKQVILTNTIYHYSGKNKIGAIHIPETTIEKFHMSYGQKIYESGLVSSLCDSKNAVYASFEAIPNSLNNEPYAYYKLKNKKVAA